MSDSETSSDNKPIYQTSKGHNLLEDKSNDKKPQSSDTDYYFGSIANPVKILDSPKSDSQSELEHMMKKTDSESSAKSSSSRRSSSSSSSKSSDSRPKYEKLNVSPKPPLFTQSNNHTSTEIKPSAPPENRSLNPQELRLKKIELLRKLCEIKAKGFQLSKDYDFNSSLEEMEYEYELLRSFADKRNGVRLFKNGLLQAVSVVEFLNDKYDPFDFHLTGWGEHMQVEVENWDEVLEEIYEKYKGTGRMMAPEIKLLFLIIASASAFHFTKSQASKVPGLDSVLASNPDLLSKMMNPGKKESSQFMTPQELNIERQREELKKKESESKMKQQQMFQQQQIQNLQEQLRKQNEMINQQQKVINANPPMFNAGSEPQPSNSRPPVDSTMAGTLPSTIPASQLRPVMGDIRAPDQVKDILSRIHNIRPATKPSNTETQDETSSQNDRLLEDSTISENNPNKKRGGRKPKRANISLAI